ncbi:hypothetical protein K3495_g8623 [Podosphaera aphanis]|nr:hypothetical protein K3495_g8623 [Podosphaera aphanis]
MSSGTALTTEPVLGLISSEITTTAEPPAFTDTRLNFSKLPDSTAQKSSVTTEDSKAPILPAPPVQKHLGRIIDEHPTSFKKNRRMLFIPLRFTQHKFQTTPKDTDLSGVTTKKSHDSEDSTGLKPKKSKRSNLRRRRNGAEKMTKAPTGTPAGMSSDCIPPSPSILSRQSKTKGLLSYLCCGTPDISNKLDPNDGTVHANEVANISPMRPVTATKSEPSCTRPKDVDAELESSEKDVFRKDVNQLQPEDDKIKSQSDNSEKLTATGPKSNNGPTNSSLDPLIVQSAINPGIADSEIANSFPTINNPTGELNQNTVRIEINSEGGIETPESKSNAYEGDENPVPSLQGEEINSNTAISQSLSPLQPMSRQSDDTLSEQRNKWLLPPIAPRFKGKKCLVLDLDETLVHSSFKVLHQADFTIPVEIEGQLHNVYVIKRPGVDRFMKRVGELYEVVVFTASVSKYGDPLLDQLDVHNVVHHRLFRESCYNHQGNYVKDLSQVGRDLRETIIIDNSPTSYIFHPQHAVPISSWFSDAHDNELLDLIPVLEDLAVSDVRDVSLVLDVTL